MKDVLLSVKILSISYAERYTVRRLVLSAQQEIQPRHPGLALDILEVKEPGKIGRYAQVLVLPTLVIEEQVVCSGRFPAEAEVAGWLGAAYAAKAKSKPKK